MSIEIVFTQSTSVLITERVMKSSFITIVFSLFGTLVGFMQIMGYLMCNTEDAFTNLAAKFEKIESNKKLLENMLSLKHNFGIIAKQNKPMNHMTFGRAKIFPSVSDEVEYMDKTY